MRKKTLMWLLLPGAAACVWFLLTPRHPGTSKQETARQVAATSPAAVAPTLTTESASSASTLPVRQDMLIKFMTERLAHGGPGPNPRPWIRRAPKWIIASLTEF